MRLLLKLVGKPSYGSKNKMTHGQPKAAFVAVILAMLLSGVGAVGVQAQTQPWQYFPETGHTVSGEFLNFNGRGGLRIFGYPITEEFEWQGRRIQYFQKARMELHPENPFAYRVQLGLLGDELGHRQPSVPPSTNDPYRRYFPETGHTVQYAFLNFYDSNGGLDIFGYPITEFTLENGRIVQYFQRARMEWHPELSGDQRVQLGDLGTIHFDAAGFDPSLKLPRTPAQAPVATPFKTTGLKIRASVKFPITARTGSQTVFVDVSDQAGNPIATANVVIAAQDVNTTQQFNIPATNQQGSTAYTFSVDGFTPGKMVVVEVRVAYVDLVSTAQTSFMPWY
jgi:hypothetical protein